MTSEDWALFFQSNRHNLESFVRRQYPSIRREAEDIVSDVCFKFMSKCYQPKSDNLFSPVMIAIRNHCTDLYRLNKIPAWTFSELSDETNTWLQGLPADDSLEYSNQMCSGMVGHVLTELKKQFKEPEDKYALAFLVLHDMEGYTYNEICRMTQAPYPTVRYRHLKALQRARKVVKSYTQI